jgi:hypothetical protein
MKQAEIIKTLYKADDFLGFIDVLQLIKKMLRSLEDLVVVGILKSRSKEVLEK